MEIEEILCDDIDAVVIGDGSEEFAQRMFKAESNAFLVND